MSAAKGGGSEAPYHSIRGQDPPSEKVSHFYRHIILCKAPLNTHVYDIALGPDVAVLNIMTLSHVTAAHYILSSVFNNIKTMRGGG